MADPALRSLQSYSAFVTDMLQRAGMERSTAEHQ